jgi:translocation and assembly module TamB
VSAARDNFEGGESPSPDPLDSRGRRAGGRRRWHWLLWVGAAIGAILVLIVGSALWVINTESGTRWAANFAVSFMGGKLELAQIRGTLAGPLTVEGIRFNDPDAGADVHVARVSVDVALMELLSRRAHVQTLDVNGVDVRLSEPKKKDEEKKPFSLEPPLDVLLDRFTLRDARVSRDGKDLFVARAAEASAQWTGKGISIQKLVVDSPDGNVHLAGEVSGSKTYNGRVNGGFRWKVADAVYAGELSATSENEKLSAQVRLSAPFAARVDATVGETEALPWQLTLAVPQFDPRKKLLPDSSIESLATTLEAHGDLTFAELRGDVAMNGKSLRIDPARVRYKEDVLTIEALTLLDPTRRGSLSATGKVMFGEAAANASAQPANGAPSAARADAASPAAPARPRPGTASPESTAGEAPPPLLANLNVHWADVELPKEWVGQPLATHGEIKVVGSATTFIADGNMALGPPGKLADIALSVAGTPEKVQVKQFAIVQKKGNFTANGTILIKPRIGWQLNASAKTFDPGALVAEWPGSLGFALDTKGELLEKGPSASLNLRDLKGTLRGRALAGQAALTVNPDKVIAGTLNVSSGRSTVSLEGRAGQSMNVDTQLDIASLEDWVPKTTGRVNGKFHITGAWPKLAVEGDAQGRDIAFGEYSVKAVDVKADVSNPQSPTGSASISANTIIAAGFEFSKVDLDASGDEKAHAVHLKATGQPLSAEVRVKGAREGADGWAGTIEQLDLAAVGISPVSLREPAMVSFNPRAFSVSQSCLAGDQISACITAAQDEKTGELNAKYTLEHLPLGLIAALAAPELPMRIEAVIEGNGTIRRTKEGALFGEAHVSSASGRISEAETAPQEDAADALLTYENLKLDAQLAGETAQGSLSSSLNGGGKLEGQAMLANLSGAAPTIDGKATLSIPDLSPVGLFVPQLSNVHGAGEANVTVTGTIVEPKIVGSAQLHQLAAEVPQVGIKLHDGEVKADLSPGNALKLTGEISSGKGKATLDGETDEAGALTVRVDGTDFQAADIPGASVVIAPDLTFQRTKDRMQLWGQVTIPTAQVDLSKLPKVEGGTSASPDVVVVDDPNPVEKSKSVPLEVNVGLIIGKKNTALAGYAKNEVRLIGYGLNATVDGWLDIHERPGEPTTGNGEIHLTGIYKAYGQDLTIEQGRLLFAGQPIDDPQVNLIGTRTVDAVKAKLTVSGSAKKPQLEVSADPTMSQTEALSYLVTGKPIKDANSGEGDLVQSAARSIGGAAGNLLAKGIGKRLGISEIGVQDSEEIGGSAFTVGQYLSPRLYLSYGVGLFEPGQVVTLRYRVSSKVSLEASQGPLSQKAGINYRIEK